MDHGVGTFALHTQVLPWSTQVMSFLVPPDSGCFPVINIHNLLSSGTAFNTSSVDDASSSTISSSSSAETPLSITVETISGAHPESFRTVKWGHKDVASTKETNCDTLLRIWQNLLWQLTVQCFLCGHGQIVHWNWKHGFWPAQPLLQLGAEAAQLQCTWVTQKPNWLIKRRNHKL